MLAASKRESESGNLVEALKHGQSALAAIKSLSSGPCNLSFLTSSSTTCGPCLLATQLLDCLHQLTSVHKRAGSFQLAQYFIKKTLSLARDMNSDIKIVTFATMAATMTTRMRSYNDDFVCQARTALNRVHSSKFKTNAELRLQILDAERLIALGKYHDANKALKALQATKSRSKEEEVQLEVLFLYTEAMLGAAVCPVRVQELIQTLGDCSVEAARLSVAVHVAASSSAPSNTKENTSHIDAGELKKMKVAELKTMLKDMGLSCEGKKEDLIIRLTRAACPLVPVFDYGPVPFKLDANDLGTYKQIVVSFVIIIQLPVSRTRHGGFPRLMLPQHEPCPRSLRSRHLKAMQRGRAGRLTLGVA
jgi:hypothetical protein